MEKQTMFLDQKNEYSENEYTTQYNLLIQCNFYQITMTFFTEAELKILQFVWKHKRLQIAKVILRKENRPGGASPQLQTILQSYSKQDSMVLTQKQKYRPMVQDRKPRDEFMHLWSPNL